MADKIIVRLRGSRTDRGSRYGCERRVAKRMLCSDLVQVHWAEPDGKEYREIAIMENLSVTGAGLFTGIPIPENIEVRILSNDAELVGRVKQCVFRQNGYVVGLELTRHSQAIRQPGQDFVPHHLLDVSLLDLD